jgi:alkylation response protein AidB-like acyl-CoA dehydrogenase
MPTSPQRLDRPDRAHGSDVDLGQIERARQLKGLLERYSREGDATGTVPDPMLDALHDAQIFRSIVPKSVGGLELRPEIHAQIVAAIAEGDAGVAWCVAQSACATTISAYLDPTVLQDVFGDPRAVFTFGFASSNPPCVAIPVAGGWRVTGTWTYGSSSRIATWLGGHSRLTDENGQPLTDRHGRPVERTMIFRRANATIHPDTWDVIGLRATGSDSYSVKDLFVPAAYSTVPRGRGRDHNLPEDAVAEAEPERREAGILYRHSMQLIACSGLSSVAIGAARAMFDEFVQLARTKTPSNSIPLRDDSWIQARVAQADSLISAAQAWLLQLLRTAWDECATDGAISFPTRIKIRQASTHQIDSAREAANILFKEAGSTALFRHNGFEQRFRDIHTVSNQVQGSIARLEAAGQFYLGLPPQQLTLIP